MIWLRPHLFRWHLDTHWWHGAGHGTMYYMD